MSIVITPIPSTIEFTAPAFTLGTSNAAGAASTAVASNSTLLTYDTTVPTTLGYAQAASVGDASTAARRNHVHGISIERSVLKKSADQSAISRTTFADDSDFILEATPNEVWLIEYRLKLSGVATGGLKWQFVIPTGAAVSWYYQCWTGTDTVASKFGGNPMTTGDANISTGSAAVNIIEAIITARVTNGSNTGNIIPQWAQETSDSTATILETESYQIAWLE